MKGLEDWMRRTLNVPASSSTSFHQAMEGLDVIKISSISYHMSNNTRYTTHDETLNDRMIVSSPADRQYQTY